MRIRMFRQRSGVAKHPRRAARSAIRKTVLLAAILGYSISPQFAATARAGFVPTHFWNLDESGLVFLSGGPPVGYANGTNKVDPASGILGLYYPLGPSVAGDVLLLEPQTSTDSDLLRFDGQGVFFFSDLETNDPNPDRADVPIMPNPINPVILNEVGPEGSNGAVYVPAPGQPGFDLSGLLPGLQYNIVSDVPEPSALALVWLSVMGLVGISRRKKW
jgi:hypothetical protein